MQRHRGPTLSRAAPSAHSIMCIAPFRERALCLCGHTSLMARSPHRPWHYGGGTDLALETPMRGSEQPHMDILV
jgi:hypothetical protein